jgi:aminoglycoside phosphotransferase (APT) family kinase protein
MPGLVACEDDALAPILVLEDLSPHYCPPPWDERRVDLVLAQIDALHNTPAALETFAELFGTPDSHWRAVAADPEPVLALGLADRRWLDTALPLLIHYEDGCRTEGTRLSHLDLRSDNMCVTAEKAIFIDWNLACLSNPELDLGFWLPSLKHEGGPRPESILPDAPEVAAWVCGFFAARAGLPPIPDAPLVSVVQRQQLATALPWAVRALDLPPLKPG